MCAGLHQGSSFRYQVMANQDETLQQIPSQSMARAQELFFLCMCDVENRGENEGKETRAWSKPGPSKRQLSANQPPRAIRRLGGVQRCGGAKINCHTKGLTPDKTLLKKLVLAENTPGFMESPPGLWLELGGCVGAGRAAELLLLLHPGQQGSACPGCGMAGSPLRPPPRGREGHGTWQELARRRGLPAPESQEVIRASGLESKQAVSGS